MTDVNYLLHRQQIAQFKACHSNDADARKAHEGMARAYSEQIRDYAQQNRMAVMAIQAG